MTRGRGSSDPVASAGVVRGGEELWTLWAATESLLEFCYATQQKTEAPAPATCILSKIILKILIYINYLFI